MVSGRLASLRSRYERATAKVSMSSMTFGRPPWLPLEAAIRGGFELAGYGTGPRRTRPDMGPAHSSHNCALS